jgi:hypothetical protein
MEFKNARAYIIHYVHTLCMYCTLPFNRFVWSIIPVSIRGCSLAAVTSLIYTPKMLISHKQMHMSDITAATGCVYFSCIMSLHANLMGEINATGQI